MFKEEKNLIKAETLKNVIGALLDISDDNINKMHAINEKKEFLTSEDITEIGRITAVNNFIYNFGKALNTQMAALIHEGE